jgi:hypothetical protein
MRQHIDILGWIYVALGVIGVLVALFIFGIMGAVGALSDDAKASVLLTGIGFFLAVFVAALSLPNLIGGWGLLKRRSWSRILVLILGCIQLLGFPFHTAIGIYTLWALTKPEAQQLLSR